VPRNVLEDVFLSDRLPGMGDRARENMVMCWKQYLEDLVKIGGKGRTRKRVEKVCEEAFKEYKRGVIIQFILLIKFVLLGTSLDVDSQE
jgi:hypothetical protein